MTDVNTAPTRPVSAGAVGALTVLAVILAALLVVVDPSPRRVEASMYSQQGDTVMFVTSGAPGTDDVVNILDARTGRLITYGWDNGKKRLIVVAATSLLKK
jgi:hypothetical protein